MLRGLVDVGVPLLVEVSPDDLEDGLRSNLPALPADEAVTAVGELLLPSSERRFNPYGAPSTIPRIPMAAYCLGTSVRSTRPATCSIIATNSEQDSRS